MANSKKKQEAQGIGELKQRSITLEMQDSYIDYAMSVIVARALPDVRDGLKPSNRRILYAMWDIGLRPSAKFRKSAYVVGEVLGKYHPHGDQSAYDAMVRMGQDFAMRYQLVHGQGNFGSMDGDSPAAMRYTEAKLRPIAEEMLADIGKDTVDFVPNYDGTIHEPVVLPARFPNLLVNGTVGIAVGMATNIPPHNLSEVAGAVIHLVDNPDASVDDLVKFVKGPDFPTGATIFDKKAIKTAYATGKGGIVIRANTEITEDKAGVFRIIVSEVPYQVNKATLIEKIADLVRSKKIEDIRDLRDESDKDGVRIMIELKKGSYPKKVLNQLYKQTSLQVTFHVNLLALVDGIQPRVLTLKSALEEFIKHRQIVIKRRTEFDLAKAKERAHILEGLKKATDNIDAVIKVIKASKDRDIARVNLMKKFRFSERQAGAILDMRLAQLANLERKKIAEELKQMRTLVKELDAILRSPRKIMSIIKEETAQIREKYGDERRTKIVAHAVDSFTAEDLVPNEPAMIIITRDGYIKRIAPETFRTQGRGGKGIIGLTTKERDTVDHFFATTTHTSQLFFTNRGRVFQLKAYDIPKASRTAKGNSLVNFLQLAPYEKVTAVLPLEELTGYKYLVMVTKAGIAKKVDIAKFESVRKSGLIAIKLKGEDSLEWVKPSTGKDHIMLVSAKGQAIRFKETDIREMGRTASGVRGIRLRGDDEVVGMAVLNPRKLPKRSYLTVVTREGFGKMTALSSYKQQNRGGSGVKTAKVTKKTGDIITAQVPDGEAKDAIIISEKGQVIRLSLKSVSKLGRATQGVRLMRFKEEGDKAASLAFM